ncbi:uncharacterized protein LOC143154085 [Ptiloglossa arizonensis]|uniref:uncharacterized protein LOC143154085 n=1 Tax=Ptiloglossa arizonensis TaxID=3350558 RepID=UPI003F9FFC15
MAAMSEDIIHSRKNPKWLRSSSFVSVHWSVHPMHFYRFSIRRTGHDRWKWYCSNVILCLRQLTRILRHISTIGYNRRKRIPDTRSRCKWDNKTEIVQVSM